MMPAAHLAKLRPRDVMTAQPEQSDEAGGASNALSQTASTANGAPRRISDPDYMESLARGLAVIRAFGNDRDEM